MQIQKIDVTSLSFDPANARKHSEANIDAIKGSLRKFGQQKPIVVGKNNVVLAGNGTLQAAIALGWKQIDIVRTDLSGPEAMAYALSDNRTAELAEWDDDILGKQLQGLFEDGFDIGEIGFDITDIGGLRESDLDEDGQDGTKKEKPFKIEIVFNSYEEMTETYDRLISEGLMAKVSL